MSGVQSNVNQTSESHQSNMDLRKIPSTVRVKDSYKMPVPVNHSSIEVGKEQLLSSDNKSSINKMTPISSTKSP